MTSARRSPCFGVALAAAGGAAVVVSIYVVVVTLLGSETFQAEAPRARYAVGPTPARDGDASGDDATEETFVRDPVVDAPEGDGFDWTRGSVPDELMARGTSSLRIRLHADTDGSRVSMGVRVWRLGVGEGNGWSAGDEIRCERLWSTAAALEVSDLPTGRYRVQCLDLRAGGTDPAEFSIGAGLNEVDLTVPHRREFTSRLRLVDDTGAAITEATRRRCPSSGTTDSSSSDVPSWASPRLGLAGFEAHRGSSLGIGCSPGRWDGESSSAGPDECFDIVRNREPRANDTFSWNYEFRTSERVTIDVSGDDTIRRDATYLAVAPRVATLLAGVVFEDGTPVPPSQCAVTASARALLAPDDATGDAWRTFPVAVRVRVPGHFDLEFTWTADTAGTKRTIFRR